MRFNDAVASVAQIPLSHQESWAEAMYCSQQFPKKELRRIVGRVIKVRRQFGLPIADRPLTNSTMLSYAALALIWQSKGLVCFKQGGLLARLSQFIFQWVREMESFFGVQ